MRPKEMYIGPVSSRDNGHLIEACFRLGFRRWEIFFASKDAVLNKCTEALVASALLPCMRNGANLCVNGEISSRFWEAIPAIQKIFRAWDPSLHEVQVQDVTVVDRIPQATGDVASFFTGGVDSFYTLLQHRQEIRHLVFVHGFDMGLDEISLRKRTSQMLRLVGEDFNKDIIEVETNLRDLLRPRIDWRDLAHGAALASVAHLLSLSFVKIYIPASFKWSQSIPCGTHLGLDPLWNSYTLEFVHDGSEVNRTDKIARLATCDRAMKNLRVCFSNPNGSYNCGRCEKCIRTMISLHSIGALDRCTTFDAPLDIQNLLKLKLVTRGSRTHAMGNLEALERLNGSDELRDALHRVLNRPYWLERLGRSTKRYLRHAWLFRQLDFLRDNTGLFPWRR